MCTVFFGRIFLPGFARHPEFLNNVLFASFCAFFSLSLRCGKVHTRGNGRSSKTSSKVIFLVRVVSSECSFRKRSVKTRVEITITGAEIKPVENLWQVGVLKCSWTAEFARRMRMTDIMCRTLSPLVAPRFCDGSKWGLVPRAEHSSVGLDAFMMPSNRVVYLSTARPVYPVYMKYQ